MRELWCEHRGCVRKDAEPQITKAFAEIRGGEGQPRWYCSDHKMLYPKVTFWGEVVRPAKRPRKEVKT